MSASTASPRLRKPARKMTGAKDDMKEVTGSKKTASKVHDIASYFEDRARTDESVHSDLSHSAHSEINKMQPISSKHCEKARQHGTVRDGSHFEAE